MKKKAFLWVLASAALLVCGLAALAADEPAKVSGTWVLTMQGPQGGMTQTLTIEQNGDKIKGTLKGPRAEGPIKGSVKGNKIRFTSRRETPRGEMTLEYTRAVEGDSMKGTMQGGRFSGDWSAKREKEREMEK